MSVSYLNNKRKEVEEKEEEKENETSRLEKRKEVMEEMMGRRSSGGLGSLMSQMITQRSRGDTSSSGLLEKITGIDQQLDRVEEKLDKLLT